jgi:hypothetical protein
VQSACSQGSTTGMCSPYRWRAPTFPRTPAHATEVERADRAAHGARTAHSAAGAAGRQLVFRH